MIKKRNPLLVTLFTFLTLGIYSIYWVVQTKNELVEQGTNIPTAWLLIIPFVNLYFFYKYFLGAVEVFNQENSMALIYFILWIIFPPTTMILIQIELNKLLL